MQQRELNTQIKIVLSQIGSVILGKSKEIEDCVACLLAGGHLLVEDVPGVGKTTFAHALSKTLGLEYSRVQFTSDMMPGDILGSSVYDKVKEGFVFHKGPIFAQVLLADEINRASPKAQSALLEAMEEHQVTVDGQTMRLPEPFFVLATQNPADQVGTNALPESQLDRFMMKVSLGYPDEASEKALYASGGGRAQVEVLKPVVDAAWLREARKSVDAVLVRDEVLAYVYRIVKQTRESGVFVTGMSPRAGIALVRVAKAYALIKGRGYVAPDDIRAVIEQAIAHRLAVSSKDQFAGVHGRYGRGLSGAALMELVSKVSL